MRFDVAFEGAVHRGADVVALAVEVSLSREVECVDGFSPEAGHLELFAAAA